jgi:hemerythrin-like domain-containing protein
VLLAERRFLPRQMDFESLIRVLTGEHRVMEAGFARMKEAAIRGDFGQVAAALAEVDPVLRQHIADEESQILRLLIGELGVSGAEEEIKVFQQHRPIHRLMQLVAELASKSAAELADNQSRLNDLFLEHTSLEEKGVFPKAPATYGEHQTRQARNLHR